MATTGRLVFGHSGLNGFTPSVYKDDGWYEGTNEEYNVRKVSVVATFEHLGSTVVKETLCGDAKAYGCRWGGGFSSLYIIANEGAIEALKQKNAKRKALAEQGERERAEQERKHYEVLKQSGLCPKCGTWCYGDCEANQ